MESREYRGYHIVPRPIVRSDGRFAVNVEIYRTVPETDRGEVYYADDGISYALRQEAAHEAINLAKRLIDRGRIGL